MRKKHIINMLNNLREEVEILKINNKKEVEAKNEQIAEIKEEVEKTSEDVKKNNDDIKRLSNIYITNSILKPNLAFTQYEVEVTEDGEETIAEARLYRVIRVTDDNQVYYDLFTLRPKCCNEDFEGLGYIVVTRKTGVETFIETIYNAQYDKSENPNVIKRHVGKAKTNSLIEAMQSRDAKKFLEVMQNNK